MTILIAEDNPVNRELLRELLEIRGYEVMEASDGQEAIKKLEQNHLDLVVLDLGMPLLDGFAVLRWIREHERLSQLPVLAATAFAMRGDREQALEAGFDGYISKPVDSRKLDMEIKRLLQTSPGQVPSKTPQV